MTDFSLGRTEDLPDRWAAISIGSFRQQKSQTFNPGSAQEALYELYSVPSHATGKPEVVSPSEIGSNKQYVAPGDVLISKINPRLNRTWTVGEKGERTQIASTEWVVFPRSQVLDPSFLKLLLSDCRLRDFLAANGSGVGGSLTRIRPDIFDKIETPLPPLNEQCRIVAKIEAKFEGIGKAVERLKEARHKLGLYRQSLLKAAFEGRLTQDWRAANPDKLEDPQTLLTRIQTERDTRYKTALDDWQTALTAWRDSGEEGKKPKKPKRPADVAPLAASEQEKLSTIPETWAFSRLGIYINWIEAGKSFKCLERRPQLDQVGVAKVSAVSWGEYDESESKTCLDKKNIKEELFIQEGDFLISRANTIELVGASVIVKTVTQPIMLSDKTLRIHFAPKDRRFFLHYLRSPAGRAEIEAKSTGNQESMRNIGQGRIKSIILPICSPAEQIEITRILDAKLSAADRLEQEIDAALARAESLKQSILKQAFSGKLVPQDPNDEPAAALLARIKADRAAAAPKTRQKKAKA